MQEVGRDLTRGIREAFLTQGPATAARLTSDVILTAAVEDLTLPPFGIRRRFSGSVSVGAGAAVTGYGLVTMSAAAEVGYITVVERVRVAAPVTGVYFLQLCPILGTAPSAGASETDTRYPQASPATNAIVRLDSSNIANAPSGTFTNLELLRVIGGGMEEFQGGPWVLRALGSLANQSVPALLAKAGVNNLSYDVVFSGYTILP